MRQRPGSSRRLFDPVLLPLLSQHHSTGGPSPIRYGTRFEKEEQQRTSENPGKEMPMEGKPNP
jgi:hypothetical protein